MSWQFDSGRPIYSQLVEKISLGVLSGAYPPGSKLPSVRELAAEAAVNPNTMQRALASLEQQGLVRSERTSGRFVTEDSLMLTRARDALAASRIEEFFVHMKELGIDRKQALALAGAAKEMKQDD